MTKDDSDQVKLPAFVVAFGKKLNDFLGDVDPTSVDLYGFIITSKLKTLPLDMCASSVHAVGQSPQWYKAIDTCPPMLYLNIIGSYDLDKQQFELPIGEADDET